MATRNLGRGSSEDAHRLRHAIYFAIAAALLVFVGGTAVTIALSVFFLYVHTHKAILFFRLQSEKKAAVEASEKGP